LIDPVYRCFNLGKLVDGKPTQHLPAVLAENEEIVGKFSVVRPVFVDSHEIRHYPVLTSIYV
jgi:hypothetical protein